MILENTIELDLIFAKSSTFTSASKNKTSARINSADNDGLLSIFLIILEYCISMLVKKFSIAAQIKEHTSTCVKINHQQVALLNFRSTMSVEGLLHIVNSRMI
jgi:hypothetical protein